LDGCAGYLAHIKPSSLEDKAFPPGCQPLQLPGSLNPFIETDFGDTHDQSDFSPKQDSQMEAPENEEKMRRGKEADMRIKLAWKEPNESVNLPAPLGHSTNKHHLSHQIIDARCLYRP
jgi:hypothetical protein